MVLPWYQNLEDKTTWVNQYFAYFDFVGKDVMSRIEANADSYANELEKTKAMTNILMTDYSDIALPSYLHEDLYSNCDGIICTTMGYWTKTEVVSSSYQAWQLTFFGIMGFDTVGGYGDGLGLRPVINLSKSLIS